MTAKDIISRAMLKRLTTDPACRLLEIDGIASITDDDKWERDQHRG